MTDSTRARAIRLLGWFSLAVGLILLVSSTLVMLGWFDTGFLALVALVKGTPIAPHWLPELHRLAPTGLGLAGILTVLALFVFPSASRFAARGDLQPLESPLGRLDRHDALALLGFAVFACLLAVGRLQGNVPYTDLYGDAANIASFSAARAHPALFVGDELLSNLQNIRYYLSATLPVLEWVKGLVGDYGLAFTAMLPFHVLVELTGFYLLGRYILRSRLWSLLFVCLSELPLPLNLGEYWGLTLFPIPRVTFQAFLPFVLLAALAWRDRPTHWPWVMLMAGGLTYAHLVSGPTWALALWGGFWLFLPVDWSWRRRLAWMFGMGLVYLLSVSPFVFIYLQAHASATGGDYARIMVILKEMYPSKILDTPAALIEFVWILAKLAVLPLAIVLGGLLWLVRVPLPKIARMIGTWCLGILVVAGLIPWVEHAIEQAYRLTPIQIDLIRGVRYLVPFMLLLAVWPLAVIYARLRREPNRRAAIGVLAAGLVMLGVWAFLYPPFPSEIAQGAGCLIRGRLVCSNSGKIGETLDAIDRLTQPGARFLATALPMQIRYRSMRPVVYNRRDGDILGMGNHADLLAWDDRDQAMQAAMAEADPPVRLADLVALGRQWGADYLLIDFPADPTVLEGLRAQIVYTNQPYSMIQLQ